MDNNILNIITSYLKGRPNKTQVEEVAADKALQEEILFARQMQFTQANKEQIKVQAILKGILTNTPDVSPDEALTEQLAQESIIQLPKTGGSKAWIWTSSLIIGLIGIFAIAFYNINSAFEENIHSVTQGVAWEEIEIKQPHFISEPDLTQKEPIDLAVWHYEKENFKAAIIHHEKYLNEGGSNDENMRLYLALSYLYDKQYENTIEVLREIKRTPFTSKHLDYYTGIALLMNDDVKAAVSYFEQIPQENEHYLSAKQILQKLEIE